MINQDNVAKMVQTLSVFAPKTPHPSHRHSDPTWSSVFVSPKSCQISVREAITLCLVLNGPQRSCDIVAALEKWRPTRRLRPDFTPPRSRYFGEFDSNTRFIAPSPTEVDRDKSLGKCKFRYPTPKNAKGVPFFRAGRGVYAATIAGHHQIVKIFEKRMGPTLGEWVKTLVFNAAHVWLYH